MDDILIHAPTAEKNYTILIDVLKICDNNNLKLNREKTTIGKDQVEYIGHILSRDGLKISNKRIESIKNMPDSMSVKGVMTILGMVTYTCKCLPNLCSVTEPLRQLIKDSSKPPPPISSSEEILPRLTLPKSEQINHPSSNHTYRKSTPNHIHHHYFPSVTHTRQI